MKPVAVGVGYILLGVIVTCGIALIWKDAMSAGIGVATMSPMVLFASYMSYGLGKKDGSRLA